MSDVQTRAVGRIFTHVNLDLDAVASVWGAKRFIPGAYNAKVELRPADWNGNGMQEGDLAVDIEAGGRGIKGEQMENGTVRSCFRSIVLAHASGSHQAALSNLVAFIDAQDTYGSAVNHLMPGGNPAGRAVLEATGINAVYRALQSGCHNNPNRLLRAMSDIFDGLLCAGLARQRAKDEACKATILPGGKVAIVRNARAFGTHGVLFDQWNVRVIVYVDDCNLGVVRHCDEPLRADHPAIVAVVQKEEIPSQLSQWFAHPAGFLYCRGSRKAPVRTPSKVSPESLAWAIAELLL